MKNMKQHRNPSALERGLSPTGRPLALVGCLSLVLFGVAVLGCGSGDPEEPGAPASVDSDNEDDLDLDGVSTGGDGDFGGVNDDGSCEGLSVGDGCAGEVYEGEAVPLDLYLMFDQSGSMSTVVDEKTQATRIDVVRTAVEAFLQDEESIGMGAGIGYFGHQPLGETTCDPADYTNADVEIGALPGQEPALLSSLAEREPTGETPTGAAIRGACDYVSSYRVDHAGRNPAILLVTDGEPKAPLSKETCEPTLDDAVVAAEECYQEKGIRIYVLGVGPSLTNLRVIAEAGGTEDAFLADLDNAQQVLEAFRAVRFAAQLPCELALSPDVTSGDGVDFSASTVAYLDFMCTYEPLVEVESAEACGEQSGWYFDEPSAPTKIVLCDVACGNVKSAGRQLFYSIGCPLQVVR